MIDRSIYKHAVKLRGYSCLVTVHSAVSARDGAKVLRCLFPSMSPEQHAQLAVSARQQAASYEASYSNALKAAFLRRYGRPPSILDYRISCIWDEALFEDDKDRLREYGYGRTEFVRIARAHEAASRVNRRRFQPRRC